MRVIFDFFLAVVFVRLELQPKDKKYFHQIILDNFHKQCKKFRKPFLFKTHTFFLKRIWREEGLRDKVDYKEGKGTQVLTTYH